MREKPARQVGFALPKRASARNTAPMSRPAPHILAVLAALAAAMLWGTTGTLQSLLPAAREPLVVGALRVTLGAAALMAFALARPAARRGFGRLPLGPLLLAAMAVAAYNMLFFAAVLLAGVGIGTAITIGSAPLWVAAYEVLRFRRLPPPRKALGQALAITGAALLVVSGRAEGVSALGLILAAGAGLCYAAYSLASSSISARAPSATIAAAIFSLAALFSLPVLLVFPTAWAFTPAALPWLVVLGFVSTGLAYALYTWSLTRLPPGTAVTLALAEPLTAWLLALAIVGETATPLKLAGAALVLTGLYLVTKRERAESL